MSRLKTGLSLHYFQELSSHFTQDSVRSLRGPFYECRIRKRTFVYPENYTLHQVLCVCAQCSFSVLVLAVLYVINVERASFDAIGNHEQVTNRIFRRLPRNCLIWHEAERQMEPQVIILCTYQLCR
jgi:hypothetical protein